MTILLPLRRAALALAALSLLLAGVPARAGALTDYLETAIVNHLFRGTAYTAPGTLYVALFTVTCTDSSNGTEVTGGNYSRPSVASGTGNWAATSGGNGTTSNSNAINFATPSAGWGTVVAWGLFDASSAGNLLVCAALTTSKTINSGDGVSFAGGALTVQVDN